MPPAPLDHGVRRIVLCGLSTVGAVVLLLSYRTSTSSALPGDPGATGTADVDTSAASAAVASAPAPGTTSPDAGYGAPAPGSPAAGPAAPETAAPEASSAPRAGASSAGAWSGTVTGPVVPIKWGEVQVRATIARGRITAVDVLRRPDENARDRQVNAGAVPVLVRETLAAQSARIDMVSGATFTSTGYVQSLQAALDRAGP